MKKSYNPISDVRNETVDLTKRLFKNISDAVHNLDDIRARANCVGNLFTRAAITQRVKLKDCCERLIFCDKSGYGRKAEELLWRKGYYEVISTAKRLRKVWLPDEAALLHQHVLAGIGQYHHLLSRLQFDCAIDLRGIIDNPVLYLDEGLKKAKNSTLTVNGSKWNKAASVSNSGDHFSNNNLEWAINVAHRCLIYVGDLCRYLLDLQPGQDIRLPAHYYTQALILKPEAGMPFNQLGTLSGTHNYSLDAVYYYMRCMCCPHTFEGAEGNLMSALDKTARWLESAASELHSPVSRLIARLLYLTRVWFCCRTSLLPLHKVCDELLMELPNCLSGNSNASNAETTAQQQEIEDVEEFFLRRSYVNEQLIYLSEDKLFKVVVILIMCMQHLEKKGSEEFMRAVALLLAIISQFLQEALLQLEKVLPPPVAPLPPTPPISENNVAVNGNSKRRHRRRRRRRRGSSEGSSDLSEGDDIIYVSSTDSDISEEELVFDERKSEDSDAEDEIVLNGKMPSENGLAGKTDAKMEREDMKCEVVISDCDTRHDQRPTTLWNSLDKENETFLHVQSLMQQGYLLQTIKICFDWLTCNMEVLRSCSQGSKPLIHRTASFLNYLIQVPMPSFVETDKTANFTSSISVSSAQLQNSASFDVNNCSMKSDKNIDNSLINKHLSNNNFFNANDEIVQLPLPEDLSLRGLPIFSWAHCKLVWNKLLSQRLSSEQESYLRICKLVKLGIRLADEKDTTSLGFDSEKKWFSVENGNEQVTAAPPTKPGMAVPNAKNSEVTSETNAVINTNSAVTQPKPESIALKHDKLMQDMGQLWLRAQVKELETKVKKTATHLPPYLVLDCDALTLHCPLVKQLAAAKKFIILIPTVVVSALDEQKRSSGRVRDTIRWLESQFRHGNRFLRAQRANEHLPLPLIKYPKKKDKEAWLFFQIVECCHFLNGQGGSKDSGLVTLLTGSPTLLSGSNTPGFSPLGIVNSAGINIEHIESLVSKWKSSYKSHG